MGKNKSPNLSGAYILIVLITIFFSTCTVFEGDNPRNKDITVLGKKIVSPYTLQDICKGDSVLFEPYIGYYISNGKNEKICFGYNEVLYDDTPLSEKYWNKNIDYLFFSIPIANFNIDTMVNQMDEIIIEKKVINLEMNSKGYLVTTGNGIEIKYWLTYDSLDYNVRIYLP